MNIHPTYNSYVSSVREMLLRRQNLPANAGDTRDASSIPGLGRSPGGGHGDPLRILAWRMPWTEEPGGNSPLGCKESHMTEVT